MTRNEARQEAKRRWGQAGRVRHLPSEPASARFVVGKQVGSVFLVRGVGGSWEEAFKAADAKKRR